MKPMAKLIMLLGILSIVFIPYLFDKQPLFTYGMILIKFSCLISMYYGYVKAEHKRVKLFWQFLFLFVLTTLLHEVSDELIPTAELLTATSISLLSYFFMILAIENVPHVQFLTIKNITISIVSLLIFSALSFCYFVLIPLEASPNEVIQKYSVTMFNLLITSILTVRLLTVSVGEISRYFKRVYGLSALCTALILLKYILEYTQVNLQQNIDFVLSSLPYAFLAFIVLLQDKEKPKPLTKTYGDYSASAMILITMLCLGILHLGGYFIDEAYIIDGVYQSVIVSAWLMLGSALVMFNTHSLVSRNQALTASYYQQSKVYLKAKNEIIDVQSQLINSEDTAIVNVSNNAILTVSMKGDCLSANPAAVQMFQYLAPQLIGMHISSLFDENDEMHYFFNYESNVFSLERSTVGLSQESLALRSDKVSFPVLVALQWAERRDAPLIVITFINLTERKRQEEQSLELKDKFIANISHEFRTPLTIINGILDRYLARSDAGEQLKEMQVAKRNGLRLVTMVEQLLELSRLRDNPKITMHYYRLTSLMAMPIDSFSRLAKQNNLSFSSSIPKDLWLECDAQAFEKIMYNLLSNAIKYTPSGGHVDVTANKENDSIVLDITDNGIGICTAAQGKIFERFERVEDVKNQSTFGVGIGLSLVNELINAHGWRISLTSELGKGSKFSVALPVAMAQKQESELSSSQLANDLLPLLSEPQSVSTVQMSHSHKVVLVIEDNVDMQSHIKQVIETQHHCMLAGSGEIGLELAQEYLPDLIVCDLMLTGIDGFAVLHNIKSNELTAHIPVVMLTARSDLESKLKGLNLSADDYLCKPFQQNELLGRIQSCIDNRALLQSAFKRRYDGEQQDSRLTNAKLNVEKLTSPGTKQVTVEDKFVEKLEAVVAKNYTEPLLDVSFVAKEMAMSERQLQRKIKVILGTTTNNFIKELRLERAKALLQEGQQIGRIAMDVGFSSQTYFGRCFKEQFGCTPKQYQQKKDVTSQSSLED